MHLDDYTLAGYLEDQVAGQEKQHLVAHLADCPACCEAVASAYAMVQAVAEAEAPLPDPAAVRRAERLVTAPARESMLEALFGRPLRLALAAVAVVGLGLVAYLSLAPPDLDRFRTPPTTRTFTATAPEDGAVVAARALSFSWSPLRGAMRYRLMLYTDDASVLWQGDSVKGPLALPDTVRLEAGVQYLWRVDALLANGSTTATELYAFTVAP